VIESCGRAKGVLVNSRAVELEVGVAGVHGNGDWAEVDLLLQVALVSLLDVGERLQSGSDIGSTEVARSILGSVGIAALSVNSSVLDDVLHGVGHETSVASLVSIRSRAIHQVLLRERDELSGREEVSTLSGASGREGPARSALTLILDRSDSSLGSPVQRVREISIGGPDDTRNELVQHVRVRGKDGRRLGGLVESQKVLRKFSGGQISVGVHGHGVGFSFKGIVSLDGIQVRFEDGIADTEFGSGVRLLVLLHEVGERSLILRVGVGAGQRNGDQKSNENNDRFHFQWKNERF